MIVVVGHGPSILSGLGSVIDTATVIRLKHGRTGRPEHWGNRTDYICGRFRYFQKMAVPFLHYADDTAKRWDAYYRKFSAAKPSHGLCAAFMAKDLFQPDELHFIGCDTLLDPTQEFRKWNIDRDWVNPHDWKAEHEALHSLGLTITDLRKYHVQGKDEQEPIRSCGARRQGV